VVAGVRTFKAALIGTGAIAREHLGALAEMPNVEIAGVCDLSAAIARMTAERFGVRRWYTDHRRMIEEVQPDLVHVTTPPISHSALTRWCLENGFNVLCEKPITVDYREFIELRQIAAASGRLLVENQNLRCHSAIRRILELVAVGEFGELVDAQVQLFLSIGAAGSPFVDPNRPHPLLGIRGGPIADFLTHLAYLAYLFTGAPLAVRSSWTKRIADGALPVDEFRPSSRGTGLRHSQLQRQRPAERVLGAGHRHANAGGDQPLRAAPPHPPPREERLDAADSLMEGLREAGALADGTVRAFCRKLAGTSRYDGLPLFIASTYAAMETGAPPAGFAG